MASRHPAPERIGDQLREEISELLAREVKDPGIGFVTLTHVDVTADLQIAEGLLHDARRRRGAQADRRARSSRAIRSCAISSAGACGCGASRS